MARRKKSLSPEERAKRNEAAAAKLATGVERILDADEFKAYLKTVARFHAYSWANCMMIMMQKPDATLVAGYAAWQKLGRQVRKGETGIQIRAPRFRKKSERDEDDSEAGPAYFSLASVFDISQTEGDELPEPPDAIALTGQSDQADAVLKLCEQYCEREEIKLLLERDLGKARGTYSAKGKSISLAPEQAYDQLAKTFVHELVHHELAEQKSDRPTGEIEAEGTAYVVCEHFGIDASSYSFPYVASWATDKEKFKKSLHQIQRTAASLIDKLEDFERPVAGDVDEVA